MWMYFYVSKKRIQHLAQQIDPVALSEQTKKWDVEGMGSGNIEFEASKLLELLGLKSNVSGQLKATSSHSTENKFTPSDEIIVESVKNYIIEKSLYIKINNATEPDALNSSSNLIWFNGSFSPIIEGKNTAEKIANYEESDFVQWHGKCFSYNITFISSKLSLVSHTPIIQCIVNEENKMDLEGFATLAAEIKNHNLPLLPLFFGIQIGDYHGN